MKSNTAVINEREQEDIIYYTLANSVTPMCANSSPHNVITHKNIRGFPIPVNFVEWRKL